jgi:hypothetical protein
MPAEPAGVADLKELEWVRIMADNEKNAIMVLTVGKPINVKETVEQIQNAMESATAPRVSPLIRVTDDRGAEHRINVNQIVEFHELIQYASASGRSELS